MSAKHQIEESNAEAILNWMQNRGGIAIWESADLSNPGRTWTTPVNNSDGTKRTETPHWSASRIARIITDPSEVEVIVPKEVERFHVAVRAGGSGLSLKLTDASSRRLRQAVKRASLKHGSGAWYAFDYSSHENAVIFVADRVMPLMEWSAQQGASSGLNSEGIKNV